MSLSQLHSCKKSEGKIVLIEVDNLRNEYCGYCHERVNYSGWFERKYPVFKEEMKKEKKNYD